MTKIMINAKHFYMKFAKSELFISFDFIMTHLICCYQ